MSDLLKIGHRGRPGNPRFGENTMRSFRAALAAGADGIEFDVRRTRDGRLVVLHDLFVDRTTNGQGSVHDLTYAELSRFDAGLDEPVPLLSNVLLEFGNHCSLVIELKESGIEEAVNAEIMERNLRPDRVIVIAADEDDNDPDADSSWKQLRTFTPDVPVGLLAQAPKLRKIGERALVEHAKEYGARAVFTEDAATTPLLVELAHEGGLQVYVWTVNDRSEIERFRAMGVDGILSDFVERLRI